MTLQRATARRFTGLVLLTCLCVGVLAGPAQAGTISDLRTGLEQRINRAREARGLRPLRVNVKIQRYAQQHAGRMADTNTLFHDSLARLYFEVPVARSWVGETVGATPAGPNAARRVHREYMDSKDHRDIILRRRATHMGIGVVKRNGTLWTVERFADLR